MKIFQRKKEKEPENTKLEWDDDRDCSVIYHMCPECGSFPILVSLTCHTYRQNDGWKACIPCDSAGDLYCPNEECNWSYTWGLNPSNPRSPGNEKYRPNWLVGSWPL